MLCRDAAMALTGRDWPGVLGDANIQIVLRLLYSQFSAAESRATSPNTSRVRVGVFRTLNVQRVHGTVHTLDTKPIILINIG